MHSIPAVLFPHTVLSRSQLEKILSIFAPLRVFVPWQMPLPAFLTGELSAELIEIERPPSEMDPGAGLKQALSEYLGWLKANPDKSGLGFLKTGAVPEQLEDPVWTIRQHIRQADKTPSRKDTAESFRNHLVLHLENELEELRAEAGRILNRLRDSGSPLEGLAGDPEETHALFQDLPGFDWAPEAGRGDLYHVIAAWLDLFRSLLQPGDILVSPDRRYVEYLTDLWVEATDPPGKPPPSMSLAYPVPAGLPMERIAEIRGKRLAANSIRELHTLLLEKAGRPGIDQDALSQRAFELTGLSLEGPLAEKGFLKAVFLPPLPDTQGPTGRRPPPSEFLGRTLIYLDESGGKDVNLNVAECSPGKGEL